MKNMKSICAVVALFLSAQFAVAQCNPGEIEVTLDVTTDTYGYETYWEIVPTGNACGVGTLASGGSTVVGCNGGGLRVQDGTAGYQNNNFTYNEGPWCLVEGNCYDLIFVDDWDDGGGNFEVKANGFSVGSYVGAGANATWTFCASEPAAIDAGVSSVSSPVLYESEGLTDISGVMVNPGTTVITSLDINYNVDGGAAVTMPLTGLNIANAGSANFTHPTQWNAPLGPHTIKVWTSNVNGGNGDTNGANDTVTSVINVVPGVPNIIDSYVGITPVITQIGNAADMLDKPSDLDFHPDLSRKELWVVNKRIRSQGGSVTVFSDAGDPGQTDLQRVDGNAWHFMALPTAIAFSGNSNFGTSQGVYNANGQLGTEANPFTGPSLWSSDLNIFAQNAGPGTNGSHLDMLHETPSGQGMANESGNAFWINDGNTGDLVRYDFAEDHGPGNDYHGDGIVHRYPGVGVTKDPNNKVSSHLVVSEGWVYSVDYGNNRVFRVELGTGTVGGTPAFAQTEALAEYANVTGYTMNDVVTTGLVEPSGIDIIEDRMLVSDYNTGDVIIYDISSMPATELGRIATGATGIMGVKIGPNGKIWYVDYDANTVNRIDGATVGVDALSLNSELSVFPNPAKNNFAVNLKGVFNGQNTVAVYDATGRLVFNENMTSNQLVVNTEKWSNGIYQVRVVGGESIISEKIIIQH